ncbi:CTP synthase [Candidatus Kuenenbacteria bacterium]|nr:CTP synthase [Candidatus Kuenenbacteria bacterium]
MKYIFVTGGVCSGLGKGIAAASIGMLLKACGYKISILKLDPYLNVDPGTMSPYQHGEVFVTNDGTETDLDLGHYERFIDENLSKLSNTTAGQIYKKIINKEREGEYLGKTIQIIPHVTETIKNFIQSAAEEKQVDFLIIEIGGTVGDIEAEPFLEAARQWHQEKGGKNVLFIHLTFLPFLKTSGELKTKLTQVSVRELQRQGLHPDIILARSDYPIKKELIEKISLFCNILPEEIIPAITVKSIYEVPLNFQKYSLVEIILKRLDLKNRIPELNDWQKLIKKIKSNPPAGGEKILKIGMIGKYTEHGDAYISVNEALKSAGYVNNVKIKIEFIAAEDLEKQNKKEWDKLKAIDGLVVPGGFGSRGIEGKIEAVKYARENKIPFLGLCMGMQIAAIEFARYVLKTKDVNSTEFDAKTKHPIIYIMPEQREKIKNKDYGASMRLGAYPCVLNKDSLAYKAYKQIEISERHRHRYEFNNEYREILEQAGLKISGTSPDGKLVEIIELKDHPWFVGVQFHPEFKSQPLRAHPLFRDFIKATKNKVTSNP